MKFLVFILFLVLHQIGAMEEAFNEQKFWKDTIELAKTLPQYKRPLRVQNTVDELSIKAQGKVGEKAVIDEIFETNDKDAIIAKIGTIQQNIEYYKKIAADTISIITGEENKTFEEQKLLIYKFYAGEQVISTPLLDRIEAILDLEEINTELQAALKKAEGIVSSKDMDNSLKSMSIPERITYISFKALKIAKDLNEAFKYGKSADLWLISRSCRIENLSEIPSPAHAILLFDISELGAAQVSMCLLRNYNFFDLFSQYSPLEILNMKTKPNSDIYMRPLDCCIRLDAFLRTASFPRELYFPYSQKKD
ncbi:MAG: hypothetical protein ACTSXG_01930 [Alphaproteobacteria bacterium]